MATSMKFQTRVVGWKNKVEFKDVYNSLYDENRSKKIDGLGRINAWKCRFADKMPVAIECTATLLEARLMERNEKEPGCLQLIYSMAIIRFVNLMTGFLQNKAQAQPVVALAKEISLPEWLVELRHEASHKHLPPLAVLRLAAQAGLTWLQENFWEKQCRGEIPLEQTSEEEVVYPPNVNGVIDEIKRLCIMYQQAQYKNIQGGSRGDVTDVISSLRHCLTDPEAKYLIVSLLLQDGYLVPTPEQLQTLPLDKGISHHDGITCIHRVLCQFWKPLIMLLDSLELTPLLLHHIIRELGRFRTTKSKVADYLVGWAMQIVMAGTVDRRMYRTQQTLFRDCPQLPWNDLFDDCIRHPNKFTLHLLQYIVPNVAPKLSEEAQLKVGRLSSIYCNTLETERPMSTAPGKSAMKIYTEEDIPSPGGETSDNTSPDEHSDQVDDEDHVDSDIPVGFVLMEKEQCLPWSLSTADVDWSKFPIGSLPGLPDDPNLLVLDIPECYARKRPQEKRSSSSPLSSEQQSPLSAKRRKGNEETGLQDTAVKTEVDCLTRREVENIKQRLQIL